MKKYTVILRRNNFLMDIFDSEDEHYVANSNKRFDGPLAAAKAAREEAAKADAPEVKSILAERGHQIRGQYTIDPDNYEVVVVFEGQHQPIFGWQPELCALMG